jgi:hypothetical protein
MSKYENGYLPKIEYWLDKVVEGRTKAGREHAKSKVLYFINRQAEVYGNPNVIAGVDFSESLNLLKSL